MLFKFNQQKAYVKHNYIRLACWGLATISLLPALSFAEPWDSKFYNPKPTKDDVILPMPCDGSLVMKKVFTPTDKPLDDVKVILGSNQKELGFAEYATPNYIAGSFSDAGKERYYLIGKYEITALQYQSVMNDTCPTPKISLSFPITDISWFDAIAFTDKYNRWLLANQSKIKSINLPNGYVRLPNNTEWEYAARGGSKVTESEFRESRFPMTKNLENYAWFSGAKSANGKLQLIGRLDPNPLDLYDILGNASEMMFDSFRMNKLDRYHGQQGGMIVRGGSYLTPESSTTSAFRTEKPFYDDKNAYKSKDVGFRLVYTTEVMNSNDKIKELDKEWSELGSETDSTKNGNVVGELEKITKQVEDEKTKKELNQLNTLLRSANQARDEQRDRSIQSALQLGAFLCANVSDLNGKFEYNDNLYKTMINEVCDSKEADTVTDDNMCSKVKLDNLKQVVDESKSARDFILKYYSDTIVNTASNYEKNTINDQVKSTQFILENSGKANMSDYLKLYFKHINQYIESGKIERTAWLQTCNEIKGKK
ncbi:Formylglycine-generating enzyme, required for sulfatase activity, contains SUMF1/FGE domain [Gilliamella bombicola]|uniref:Formylglycine-generating enzyme, required for sulfatase activity, contains SUMF1/FGE domain n=1 Tax=Gilliamella bombicola TaxID=1798182 RepID=A0A1C4BNS0_9GAMM|nr:Formylglycine-generating enzyme, required for sulfatase activity, contains SUMF1/FGE domain [Gilliamella bombicola]